MARQPLNKIKEAAAYFKATEEVSKPIAFLMLFFSLAFIASVAIGVFLLGKWSYNKIVKDDQPVVVTTSDTATETNVTVVPSGPSTSDNKSVITSQQQSTTPINTSLPNTGTGKLIEIYIAIAVLGFISHQYLMRTKYKKH